MGQLQKSVTMMLLKSKINYFVLKSAMIFRAITGKLPLYSPFFDMVRGGLVCLRELC